MSFALTGCGAAFQTALGWSSVESRTVQRRQDVAITTELEGAVVQRRGPDGVLSTLGRAPLADHVEYPVTETYEVPDPRWPFWVGVSVDLISYGTPVLASTASGESFGALFGAFLGVTLAADLIAYLVMGTDGERLTKAEPLNGSSAFVYSALGADGRAVGEQVVRVPKESKAHIISVASGSPLAPAASSELRILAVMEVSDAGGIETSLRKSITDQLRVTLAARGFRTVDRGAQEKALAEQIRELKKESYESCYDASCQIELGQALAATHIVRSQITRFGSACVLMAEMIDLRAEVTVGAASATGDCAPERFIELSERVGKEIAVK
ncbi:MAG: hypothetical protein HY791_06400 [Deltaproteobacteria bacterium]|nr:hypothetical protein [Deltaproteobacteria bacterium]